MNDKKKKSIRKYLDTKRNAQRAEKKADREANELNRLEQVINGLREPYVALKYPGRNQPCLCGSGKKFKKCHYILKDGKNIV